MKLRQARKIVINAAQRGRWRPYSVEQLRRANARVLRTMPGLARATLRRNAALIVSLAMIVHRNAHMLKGADL